MDLENGDTIHLLMKDAQEVADSDECGFVFTLTAVKPLSVASSVSSIVQKTLENPQRMSNRQVKSNHLVDELVTEHECSICAMLFHLAV